MMARCENPECRQFKDYGARGITVEPYLHDITNYVQYISTLPMPEELGGGKRSTRTMRELLYAEYRIDRIDNDGNYERGNLRWASVRTQLSNRRPCKARNE